ncbi:MAG: hypothetical protein ABIH63_03960 [archaeon]
MEPAKRWYDEDPLSRKHLEKIMEEEEFRPISEISPCMEDQSKLIKVGDKIVVLMNNGLKAYYTITALRDKSGYHAAGRDETGIQQKGMEFSLDSSMGNIYDFGYKVVEKFPWE